MMDLILKGKISIDNMEFNHIEGGFGKGKKAILVKDIADIHDRELFKINELINNNRKRFKDNIDIIDLKGTNSDILLMDNGIYTQNAVNRSRNIYLLSERGYSKLLKILEDDFAWEQYEKLVDNYFNMRQIIKAERISELQSNNNPLQQQKEKLKKAVITSNYLIDYIGSSNGLVPDDILNSFTTVIQAVNIDIIDHLRNMNKIQQTRSHH
ncbi:ORF6N domain-containing protein [Tissierella sp.]|uniref:ORF6N domain-containing protein n=1 Tax=Tissierella sp. TaxID=41274 RepID=UPI00305FAAB6